MNENRSPKRIFYTLISIGITIGMLLDQFIWLAAGKLESSFGTSAFLFLISMVLLPIGWRMVSSLPWGAINDPARFEYRNPNVRSETAGDGGEKDSRSVPSRSPAPQDLER
jgi:hypothetical protein